MRRLRLKGGLSPAKQNRVTTVLDKHPDVKSTSGWSDRRAIDADRGERLMTVMIKTLAAFTVAAAVFATVASSGAAFASGAPVVAPTPVPESPAPPPPEAELQPGYSPWGPDHRGYDHRGYDGSGHYNAGYYRGYDHDSGSHYGGGHYRSYDRGCD
jgi:hypothetical protein